MTWTLPTTVNTRAWRDLSRQGQKRHVLDLAAQLGVNDRTAVDVIRRGEEFLTGGFDDDVFEAVTEAIEVFGIDIRETRFTQYINP